MSISPPTKEESHSAQILAAVRAQSHRTTKIFFENPLHYIFWLTLTGCIVGLLFGARFPAELYAILMCLGTARFVAFIYRDRIKADHGGTT